MPEWSEVTSSHVDGFNVEVKHELLRRYPRYLVTIRKNGYVLLTGDYDYFRWMGHNNGKYLISKLIDTAKALIAKQNPPMPMLQDDCNTPGCKPSMGVCIYSRCVWDTSCEDTES